MSKAVVCNVDNSITNAWRTLFVRQLTMEVANTHLRNVLIIDFYMTWNPTAPFKDMNQLVNDMAFKWDPIPKRVTPEDGVYANEVTDIIRTYYVSRYVNFEKGDA
jgi:hypothetical protein